MADPRPADAPSSFTLDLSTGKPGRTKRKGFVPVVQKTIDLSTPKPKAEAREEPAAPPPAPTRARDGRPKNDRPRGGGGNSLADLLDPETLAKLRGG